MEINNKLLIAILVVLLAIAILLGTLLVGKFFGDPSETTPSSNSTTTTTTGKPSSTTTTTTTTITTTTTTTAGNGGSQSGEVYVYDIFCYDVDPDNDGYRILGLDPDFLAYQSVPREIVVPKTINGKQVTAIGNSAFSLDTDKIVLPEGLIDIYPNAFYQCRATEINIPSTVVYIGSSAFKKCYFLESITIPAGVDTIRDETFRECTNLASVTVKGNVSYVGNYAFAQLQTLTSLTLPKGCEAESTAFNYSPNLTVKYE